jgi:general secretion pathway protein A
MTVGGLEQVRLLSNFETDSQKLLQICLFGQPELRRKLARPELRQLAQRITVRYHLQTLSPNDTEAYLRHRLAVAAENTEAPSVRFDAEAVDEIYRFSRGTPRLINAIGDKALLAGYVYRTGQIDRRLAQMAAAELLKEAP